MAAMAEQRLTKRFDPSPQERGARRDFPIRMDVLTPGILTNGLINNNRLTKDYVLV